MAITVTIVGSQDRILEDRLRAAGMRPAGLSTADLATLAHPSSTPPDVVVLDLRSQTEIPPVLAALKRQHPDTGLIIVAATLDPALMLEAMRAGVTECITEVERGDLEAAVARLVAQRMSPVVGEVFVFVGAKGGVGTTTAAVNTATALSKIGSTLIIDLHLSGGDAALFMGADSRFSVVDALENTHRLDDAYFRSLVTHTKAGPDLLASPDRTVLKLVDSSRVRALVEFCANHFRYTVIDIPQSDPTVLDALESAATIVVVANQELSAVRSAARLTTVLRQRYGKERVDVALSRPDKQAEIGLEDLETAVGGSIKHVFPNEYRLAVAALNKGQPLVTEGKSALATAFKTFARELSGAESVAPPAKEKPSGGLLGRLAGRR